MNSFLFASHHQLNNLLAIIYHNEKPTCVIAHTTKGKGVSFMENSVGSQAYLKRQFEIDAQGIVAKVKLCLNR